MLLSIDLPQYTTLPLPLLTVGLMPQTMKATNDMFNFFDLLLNKMENIIKSFNHASHAGHAADQRTHPLTGPWWLGPVVHSSICSFTHPFIHSDNHSTVAPQLPPGQARFIGYFRVCGSFMRFGRAIIVVAVSFLYAAAPMGNNNNNNNSKHNNNCNESYKSNKNVANNCWKTLNEPTNRKLTWLLWQWRK